jgi:hypothetical protein
MSHGAAPEECVGFAAPFSIPTVRGSDDPMPPSKRSPNVAELQRNYKSITIAFAFMLTMMAGSAFAQTKDKEAPVQTPFQARVIVTPTGNGFATGPLDIPEGKRFVIKNVSVITRSPEGMRMELNAMPPANSGSQAQFTFSGYLEDLPTPE